MVLRINRKGLMLGSKPCDNCNKLLNAVGLNDVFYSTDSGDFCDSFGDLVFNAGLTQQYAVV